LNRFETVHGLAKSVYGAKQIHFVASSPSDASRLGLFALENVGANVD
jgi:hypothetical protein